MQTPENQPPDDAGLNAPPKLVSTLRRASERPVFVPRAIDDRILHAAAQHLQKPVRTSFNWLRLVRWGTAAAALALLALLTSHLFRRPSPNGSQNATFAREDINHDGRVDILDAFALARKLKAGEKPGPLLDVNGDGVIDDRDVTALAAKAVELPKGGPS